MFETLLRTIYDSGWNNIIYYVFHVLGFVSVFLFVVWYGKFVNITRKQSAYIVLIVFPIVYFLMFVLYWMESGFKHFGGNNIVRVFIYIPLVGLLVTKIYKIEWKKVCALLSYCPLIVHGVSHFGCIFNGCCYGYSCDWGMYNPMRKAVLFPLQPLEALTAWGIVAILLLRQKKKNFVADGLEFPIMLILFGSTRFVWEFFRDNSKLWLGCSNLAFHALFMFIVGLVAYIIIKMRLVMKHRNIKGSI